MLMKKMNNKEKSYALVKNVILLILI